MIKKKLAGNQLVIAYMRKSKAFNGFILKPIITAKATGKQFKPIAQVEFKYGDKKVDFIYLLYSFVLSIFIII